MALLMPFELPLWIVTIITIFIYSISLSLISKLEALFLPHLLDHATLNITESLWFSFRNLVWESSSVLEVSEKNALRSGVDYFLKILNFLKFIQEKLILWIKKSTLEAALEIKAYRLRCRNVSN